MKPDAALHRVSVLFRPRLICWLTVLELLARQERW